MKIPTMIACIVTALGCLVYFIISIAEVKNLKEKIIYMLITAIGYVFIVREIVKIE